MYLLSNPLLLSSYSHSYIQYERDQAELQQATLDPALKDTIREMGEMKLKHESDLIDHNTRLHRTSVRRNSLRRNSIRGASTKDEVEAGEGA